MPSIELHSVRKLEVLRKYLDTYFDTVAVQPKMDQLNITIVDGFCGGGLYKNGASKEPGSPLVLIQAVADAEQRLNIGREKSLRLNAKFVFVDNVPEHIESLKQTLIDAGYGSMIGQSIELINLDFAVALPKILQNIKSTQRKGRSIFVLDQLGYKDVPMTSIKEIFKTLARPEVILTFAIDSVLNYLRDGSERLELYRQFGIDQRFISEWQANKDDEALGRLITQRALMSNIQMNSGAEFFTPFMLWSRTDNRWMMLAHLSRHQAARDKMLSVHWDVQNSFTHIGPGSLFSLGFDTRLIEARNSLFEFSENDKVILSNELSNDLPRELHVLLNTGNVSVQTLLETIGNRTAATNQDIFKTLAELAGGRELELVSKKGIIRRSGSAITVSDEIRMPKQSMLFGLLGTGVSG